MTPLFPHLSIHPFPGDLIIIHIRPHVTTPTTVFNTWPQVTPMTLTTLITTARCTNEPRGMNGNGNELDMVN